MKPDKHKKKKSELYMKKHNGVDGGSGGIKGIHEQRKLDQSSVVCGKGQRIESTTTDSHLLARNGLQKLENSSDMSTDTTKYGRRKLESNWNKYELDSANVEEEATMRGADYSELILLNKHVLPEYQFDSFSDTTGDAAAEEKDDFTKHVSLDCEMLSFAIRCVPLCERLDIDESFFYESELAAFKKDAADQLKGYQAFLDSRKAAQGYASGNNADSEQIRVTETNVVTLRDLDIDSNIMSTTETTYSQRLDGVRSCDLPSTVVKSVSEQNESSQDQVEASSVQVMAASVLSPESTEGTLTSDSSDCKLLDSIAQLGESDATRSTDVAINKPQEVSAAKETREKPIAGCLSVKDKSTDSISLAELEDELDSLLAF